MQPGEVHSNGTVFPVDKPIFEGLLMQTVFPADSLLKSRSKGNAGGPQITCLMRVSYCFPNRRLSIIYKTAVACTHVGLLCYDFI